MLLQHRRRSRQTFLVVSLDPPRLLTRQLDRNDRALTFNASDVHYTLVVANYLVNDRQTKAGAAARRGCEGLEKALDLLRFHSFACVLEHNANTVSGERFGSDRKRAAVRHCVYCI